MCNIDIINKAMEDAQAVPHRSNPDRGTLSLFYNACSKYWTTKTSWPHRNACARAMDGCGSRSNAHSFCICLEQRSPTPCSHRQFHS
jgi:hypothetical protein